MTLNFPALCSLFCLCLNLQIQFYLNSFATHQINFKIASFSVSIAFSSSDISLEVIWWDSSKLSVHSQIRSYYFAANANAANPNPNSKFDQVWQEKGRSAVAVVQGWHFKCTPPFSLQTNQNNPSSPAKEGWLSANCIFPRNRFWCQLPSRAGVQLILVQGSSPPGIVLLWDPRGAGQGVCGPRGASFTNTAAAENLNCKGGKNRVAWMADILGWHNDQVGRKVPSAKLHNWNRQTHHFSNRAAELTQGQFFVVEKTKKKEIWKNKLLNY